MTHVYGATNNYASPPSPPYPTGTPSGTVDFSQCDFNSIWGQGGIMAYLTQFGEYIDAHPEAWQAQSDLAKFYLAIFQHYNGQVPAQIAQEFQSIGGDRLMLDGIETGALFAYKNGWNGNPPGEASYIAYLQSWQQSLQVSGYQNDPILNELASTDGSAPGQGNGWLQYDINNADAFTKAHTDPNGNAGMYDPITGAWFDFNDTGDSNINFTIDSLILFGGGISGDLSTLDGTLGALKKASILNMIDDIVKKYGPMLAIMVILASMGSWESDYMNQIQGNNDIENEQHQFNQNIVTPITNGITGIVNWSSTENAKDGQSFHSLRESILEMIASQGADPRFQSLPMQQFIQYLQTNSVPLDSTANPPTTVTLYNLLIKQTDDKGMPLNDSAAALLLKQGLAPNPPSATPPPGTATPPPVQGLQGLDGSINTIVQAFTSSSNQITTLISQLSQMLQALYKMATGAVDPKNGLLAITQNSVNHQVAS